MNGTAYFELCAKYGESQYARPPLTVRRGFEAIDMIRVLASADPYVINENIRQFADEAPTGLAALPGVLSELAELAQNCRESLRTRDTLPVED
jgi:hypothetical protein